jgi:hypothetical protein
MLAVTPPEGVAWRFLAMDRVDCCTVLFFFKAVHMAIDKKSSLPTADPKPRPLPVYAWCPRSSAEDGISRAYSNLSVSLVSPSIEQIDNGAAMRRIVRC